MSKTSFHPDRDGCDCERRGLTYEDECVHADPCWESREAYERTLAPPRLSDAATILRLAQALRLLRDTGSDYTRNVARAALEATGIPDPPEEDHA